MDEKMRGLNCNNIEVDEIWGFIGAKRKNADRAGVYGDVWTFIALDADTKLIPSFVVGKRDAYHAKAFIADLAGRMPKRVQVSSDSLAAYADAMESGFGTEVDYGQISKTYCIHQPQQRRGRPIQPGGSGAKLKRRLCLECRTLTAFPRLTLKSRITRCGCIAAA